MKKPSCPNQMGLMLPCIFILTSCVQTTQIRHDTTPAAQKAEQFARAAFVERDYQKAQQFTSSMVQKGPIPLEELQKAVPKMHDAGYPTEVTITEYEPIPGQRSMYIYATGTNGEKKYYYRFGMSGDVDAGYKVGAFWINKKGPYPSNSLRAPLD